MTTTRLYTAEDLFEMGDTDGSFELVRGELVPMTPTGGAHGGNSSRIDYALRGHAELEGLGFVFVSEVGFILSRDPDVVRAPDVSFVLAERLPDGEPDGFIPFAPDIAVEVVSPSDRQSDVQAKVVEYLDAGTRLVVVVEPKSRTVTVYAADGTARVLREGDTLDGGDVLPGFRLPLARIFG